MKLGLLYVTLDTGWAENRLSSTSCLMPDQANGSPGRGPPCLSSRAVSATELPLLIPQWRSTAKASYWTTYD